MSSRTLALLLGVVPAFGAESRHTFVALAAPEAAAIRQTGEAASALVATRLVTELTAALGAGGPEKAVEVCHTRALPLTDEPLPNLPQVTAVKRTSLRLRNPANAPDAAEQAASTGIPASLRAPTGDTADTADIVTADA